MGISLKDLARECDCSVTSVSRALKNSDTISIQLRELVQSKAKELGYIPNMLARSMRRGYTNTIAVILADLRNPFFSLIAHYMERYASKHGYRLIFMNTGEDTNREYECILNALQRNVDGILLLPNQQDTAGIELLKKKNYPFVLFGRAFPDVNTDYVIADDTYGAYIATRHLIERGHRDIMFMNSFMHISSSQERLNGYRQALNESGIPFKKEYVYTVSTNRGDSDRMVREIFSESQPYTAIFCYCDVIAFEAMYALSDMGFDIPKDIAIAGVDDLHSDITLPLKFTSAGTSRSEYASKAIDTLIYRMKHPFMAEDEESKHVYKHEILDMHLTIGKTT